MTMFATPARSSMRTTFTGAALLMTTALAPMALASTAMAQTTPDAGQVLRDNKAPLTAPVTQARPSLSIPDEADTAADTGQTAVIDAIRIEGAEGLSEAELTSLLDGLTGREVTLGDLRAGARRITAHYRQKGFVVARAYIPAQQLENGVLIVRVLEGRLASAEIVNRSVVRDPVLHRFVEAQALGGKVIASAATDRTLLLLADLPGVGKVAGKLRPGAEVGTSDLIINADAGKRIEGQVGFDNHGNRYTGENRFNAQATINSPLHLGDRLAVQASVTEENLVYGRAAYDLPIGGHGWRAGVAASSSTYELGQDFANLEATGTAKSVSLYATYPLVRSLTRNVWLNGNIERRDLEDRIASVGVDTDKSAEALSIDVYGDQLDAFAGGGYTTWRLSATLGDLSIDTPLALAIDTLGPRTAGEYKKINFSLTRLQTVGPKTSLLATLSAQSANKNLDSSEKFVIGGIYGVRAYPQGEGSGDKGWLANVELRHQVLNGLQLSAFYDIGHVQFNQTPYSPGQDSQDLRGYGLAAMVDFGHWTSRVNVAWRDTAAATTVPDRNPRIWWTLGYRF